MIDSAVPVVCLASASAQRATLLAQLGVPCLVRSMDIDEQRYNAEPVSDYVARLAVSKAQAGFQAIGEELPTLGADTVIHADGEIFGKPVDRSDAVQMLTKLSGRTHEVVTGAGIVTSSGVRTTTVLSLVTLGRLSKTDIDRYWSSGEPIGKAGAYAIQGGGAALINRIEGSYSNVVGLPLFEVSDLLLFAGIELVRRTITTELTDPLQ